MLWFSRVRSRNLSLVEPDSLLPVEVLRLVDELVPVLVLGLVSAALVAGAGAGGAAVEQAFFFPLPPLVTVTPPAIPAKRSSLLLVFNNAAAAPGFTGLLPAEAEQLLSGLALSAACALLVPDTLGAEPALLPALFILGCLFVTHSQANLWRETALHREQDCKRALQKFVLEGPYQEIETSES